ncbi:hypothetical protein [Lentzea sp. CA-135723]|uniref:hypothetical protein n=1 Tax=Lentzea sp. CA-135723 TaxID=3239950 RepID=UPI003D92E5F2
MVEDVIARGVVQVEHHMLVLRDTQATAYPDLPPGNGLAGVADGVLVVFTGVAHGPVSLTIHVREQPPAELDEHRWDEIVELSTIAAADMSTDTTDLPALTSFGAGTYRLRVHARGRDTAPDATAADSAEECLVISWPQRSAPEVVHKQTDSYGEQVRSSRSAPGPWIQLDPDQQARDAQLRRATERH